jgi:hypothetical protein
MYGWWGWVYRGGFVPPLMGLAVDRGESPPKKMTPGRGTRIQQSPCSGLWG